MTAVRTIEVAQTTWNHRIPLAKFWLDDRGIVHSSYHSDSFQQEVEDGLVYSGKTGPVLPVAGALFMDVLAICFSNSSRMEVTDSAASRPRADAWSEEAREASAEARKANAHGPATTAATDASHAALKTGTKAAHGKAQKAHAEAAAGARKAGDPKLAEKHAQLAQAHGEAKATAHGKGGPTGAHEASLHGEHEHKGGEHGHEAKEHEGGEGGEGKHHHHILDLIHLLTGTGGG